MVAINRHFMVPLLARHAETERLANKSMELFEGDMTYNMGALNLLATQSKTAREEEVEAYKSRSMWNVASSIVQYIASVGLIIAGQVIGGNAGMCLTASGALGLTLRIVQDTHLLQIASAWFSESKAMQRKIASHIEMGAFFLQMGLGLAGGALAYQAGAAAAATLLEKASTAFNVAHGVANTTTQVGVKIYDKKIADLQAKLREISAHKLFNEQTMTQDTGFQVRMIQSAERETDDLKKAIQSSTISIDV